MCDCAKFLVAMVNGGCTANSEETLNHFLLVQSARSHCLCIKAIRVYNVTLCTGCFDRTRPLMHSIFVIRRSISFLIIHDSTLILPSKTDNRCFLRNSMLMDAIYASFAVRFMSLTTMQYPFAWRSRIAKWNSMGLFDCEKTDKGLLIHTYTIYILWNKFLFDKLLHTNAAHFIRRTCCTTEWTSNMAPWVSCARMRWQHHTQVEYCVQRVYPSHCTPKFWCDVLF